MPLAEVAVIRAVPLWDSATTRPVLVTVATAGLLEDQLTRLFVALAGRTVAVSCRSSPVCRPVRDVLSSMTFVTSTEPEDAYFFV